MLILLSALAVSSAYRKDTRVFPLTVAGTPFAGFPSAELDHAWHELLEGLHYRKNRNRFVAELHDLTGTIIKVSAEDLGYYNVTSLPLADGSGFASEIFMTHELHCLVSTSMDSQSHNGD